MFENAKVVKQGVWYYNNTIKCTIKIIQWHILYGTGDYQDSLEICNDREINCYYILMESSTQKGHYPGVRGGFISIEEAMNDIENSINQNINWD